MSMPPPIMESDRDYQRHSLLHARRMHLGCRFCTLARVPVIVMHYESPAGSGLAACCGYGIPMIGSEFTGAPRVLCTGCQNVAMRPPAVNPAPEAFPMAALASVLVMIEDRRAPLLGAVMELPEYWQRLVVSLAARAGCPMPDAPWRYDTDLRRWVEVPDAG
jgi:hypothetical protein